MRQMSPTIAEWEPKARDLIERMSKRLGGVAFVVPNEYPIVDENMYQDFMYNLAFIYGGQVEITRKWNAETCLTMIFFKPPHKLTPEQLKSSLEFTLNHKLYHSVLVLTHQAIYNE